VDNTTKPETISSNLKSGSKVAAENNTSASRQKSQKWAGRWTNLASDHSKRWEKRLYTPKSGGVEVGKLAVRIQHLGEREEFRFNTTNRQAAAAQALDLFRFLKANGWKATRAKFKPEAEGQPKLDVTVGDYLAAVDSTRRLRARTFDNYRRCLRTVVAESFGIQLKAGESKYDYRTGGNAAWSQRVDEFRLERLTPDVVNSWKRDRVASAGHAPAALASARRTVNSYTTDAKKLLTGSTHGRGAKASARTNRCTNFEKRLAPFSPPNKASTPRRNFSGTPTLRPRLGTTPTKKLALMSDWASSSTRLSNPPKHQSKSMKVVAL
jgi:hypothetical protein